MVRGAKPALVADRPHLHIHWSIRMHLASVGVSKLCFLFSLVVCGLLLLLIPALQPSQHQGDLPQPRPHTRPARAGKGAANTLRNPAGLVVPLYAGETALATDLNGSSAGQGKSLETEVNRNGDDGYTVNRDDTEKQGPGRGADSHRQPGGDSLLWGRGGGPAGSRSKDPLELKDIFIAVKTTRKYHKSRLELLFQTWVSRAKEQVGETVCYCVRDAV